MTPETLTVRVPFVVRKRGGRKLVLAPDGTAIDPSRPRIDSALTRGPSMPSTAATPPWAQLVLVSSGRFLVSTTTRPCSAACRAK